MKPSSLAPRLAEWETDFPPKGKSVPFSCEARPAVLLSIFFPFDKRGFWALPTLLVIESELTYPQRGVSSWRVCKASMS